MDDRDTEGSLVDVDGICDVDGVVKSVFGEAVCEASVVTVLDPCVELVRVVRGEDVMDSLGEVEVCLDEVSSGVDVSGVLEV